MTTVFLHGFGGSGADWAGLGLPGLTPDLPGHGSAGPCKGSWLLSAAANDVLAGLPERFDLVGYSLGGRVALTMAMIHPERVNRLVLVSASPGLSGSAARAERRERDEAWAAMLRDRGSRAFFDAWLAQPLFAGREPDAAWLARRHAADPGGLACAIDGFSPGRQPDLTGRLATLRSPTLWVAGERDAKYAAIARTSAALMPNAQSDILPDAGHDLLTERPAALTALLQRFFTPDPTPSRR